MLPCCCEEVIIIFVFKEPLAGKLLAEYVMLCIHDTVMNTKTS